VTAARLHRNRRSPSLAQTPGSQVALDERVTVAAGSIESSSERGSMARKRYQKGHVYLDGQNWKGRYREDVLTDQGTRRIRREVILGSKKELPTRRLAERRMEVALARINGLDYRPSRVATFSEFLEKWKVEILTKQKPSSARAVKSHLKCYIVPRLGNLRLEQFGVENQQVFVTEVLKKGISRKTLLNVLCTLSSILATARNWGYNCEQIQLGKLRLPAREANYEAPHFTTEQLRRILAIADEPWRTLFAILAMTGLRAGEALGLQIGDIDFARLTISVRRSAWFGKTQTTKTKASETVLPVPGPLSEMLASHIATLDGKPETFLFVTRNNRPPSSNKVVEYRLWTVLDALNIPRCGLHAFRHTHTALLLDSGATPKVVQRQLRHSDARTTLEVYGHIVGDAQRQAVEKVASVLDAIGRPTSTVN
jgi:integrase